MRLKRIASLILILAVSLLIVSCAGSNKGDGFNVVFDTDGGSEVSSQLVAEGAYVTEPEAPVKEGYTFVGWYFGGEKWDFSYHVVNSDITLTAKWEMVEIEGEHTHSPVVDEAKAPTCTETGLTEGSHCSGCGEVIVAQEEVAAPGHSYSINAVAPGCITGGYVEYTCKVCNHSYKDDEVEPQGHTPGVAATCNDPQVCAICSTLLAPALGHDVVYDSASTPDCENNGLTEGSHCGVCNEIIVVQNVIPALGHNAEGAVAHVDATCTEAGVVGGNYCTRCNDGKAAAEAIISALGHNAEGAVAHVDATCTEAGVVGGNYCTRCNEGKAEAEQSVSSLGHTEVIDNAVAPDCENNGLTEGSHCGVCNAVLVAQNIIPALGHTASEHSYKAPTCTEAGWSAGAVCSVCDKVLDAQDEIPALGHTEVIDTPVAPDCVNTGLTEGKHCPVCGEILVAQETVPALGHTEIVDAAVDADCENNGLTEGKHCQVCSEIIVAQEFIPALGHTEIVDAAVAADCENSGLTEGKHCAVCDKVLVAQQIVAAKGHVAVIDVAVKPTCINTGLTEGSHCSACNKVLVAQETVAATGNHTYVNGICTTEGCGATHEEWVKVTYVLHGGENDERNVELYLIGTYPELYDATREGYIFRGWYDSISYNNKVESLYGVDENITLYALWVKDSTGGSGGSSTTTPEVPI